MKCFNCNLEGLQCHENWPATKILINPQTQAPHQCDPRDIIIREGKWRGFSRREAAQISTNQERIHNEYLAKLREMFKSPYET
jgi:hypothetical protein